MLPDLRAVVCDDVFGDSRPVLANCINPDHVDDTASMAVYADGVKCFGCGKYWNPARFLADAWGVDIAEALRRARNGQRVHLTTIRRSRAGAATTLTDADIVAMARAFAASIGDRMDYLHARGLTTATITTALLGYTGSAYSIPIVGPDGDIQTVRYRRDDRVRAGGPKYWGTPGRNQTFLYVPPLFAFRDGAGHPRPVILCEGELDALLLAQCGLRAVSLTNGVNALRPEHIRLFEGAEVWVWFDADEPGRAAAWRVAEMLGMPGAVIQVDFKDPTDMWQRNSDAFESLVQRLRRRFSVEDVSHAGTR